MRALWLSAVVVFAIDQLSKAWIIYGLNLPSMPQGYPVLPPLLQFHMGWNTGINFGLMSGANARWVLIALAVVISAWVYWWMSRERPGLLGLLSAGALIGGALGNALDRAIYGAVADFLNMSCCGIVNPYTFNLADVGIFAGAIGLVFFTGKSESGRKT